MRSQQTLKKCLLVLALVCVALLLATSTIYASPTQKVSGTFDVINTVVTSVQPTGNNCFIELDAVFGFRGDLEGSFTAHFEIVHHGLCTEAARENFRAQGTYTGLVGTSSGAFDFNFNGRIDALGNAEGQLIITNGTDGLADLYGLLTLTGQTGVGGSYSGFVQFRP